MEILKVRRAWTEVLQPQSTEKLSFTVNGEIKTFSDISKSRLTEVVRRETPKEVDYNHENRE